MRLRDDVRKSVVFIGDGEKDSFSPFGTAFLVFYKGAPYLITARHVASEIGDCPCTLRVNHQNGVDPVDMTYDPVEDVGYQWRFHPDNTVDAAAMLFRVNFRAEAADIRYLPESLFVNDPTIVSENIGAGDFCYTVGLFRLLHGKNRNLPFVHTGHIGMMPGDEKVPIENKWDVTQPKTVLADVYLVENNSLNGLSGSPVFVRPSTIFEGIPDADGKARPMRWADEKIWLLGLWQGAWRGDPDQLLKEQLNSTGPVRVAVGVGVVIPAAKLIEILETPDVIAEREEFLLSGRSAEAD